MKNDLRKELKNEKDLVGYLIDAIDTFLVDNLSKSIKIETREGNIYIALNSIDQKNKI